LEFGDQVRLRGWTRAIAVDILDIMLQHRPILQPHPDKRLEALREGGVVERAPAGAPGKFGNAVGKRTLETCEVYAAVDKLHGDRHGQRPARGVPGGRLLQPPWFADDAGSALRGAALDPVDCLRRCPLPAQYQCRLEEGVQIV